MLRQADYPFHVADKSTLCDRYSTFLERYMQDCYTPEHVHDKIKEFNLKNKLATNKQKTFALVYTRYIDFSDNSITKKIHKQQIFLRFITLLLQRV